MNVLGVPEVWSRLAYYTPPATYMSLVKSHPFFWKASLRSGLTMQKHFMEHFMYHLTCALGQHAQTFLTLLTPNCYFTGGFLLAVLNGHAFGDIDIVVKGSLQIGHSMYPESQNLTNSDITSLWPGEAFKAKWTSLSEYTDDATICSTIDSFIINGTIIQFIFNEQPLRVIDNFDFVFVRNHFNITTGRLCMSKNVLKRSCVVDFTHEYYTIRDLQNVGSTDYLQRQYGRICKYVLRGYDIQFINVMHTLPNHIDRESRYSWYNFWRDKISEAGIIRLPIK